MKQYRKPANTVKTDKKPFTPDDYAKGESEHAQQVALFMWASDPDNPLHDMLTVMHAIPNGGQRGIVTAVNLKAEGVKSGVPDIFLPVAKRGFHGMYIEMKKPALYRADKPTHGVSAEQSDMLNALSINGYYCVVCYTYQQAREAIKCYLT